MSEGSNRDDGETATTGSDTHASAETASVGGLRTISSGEPDDIADVSRFLSIHPDAPAIEITRSSGGESESVLLRALEVARAPSGAIRCLPASTHRDAFTLPVENLHEVRVVEPVANWQPERDSPRGRARAFDQMVWIAPEMVSVADLNDLLADDILAVRRDAVVALRWLAVVYPEKCEATVSRLAGLLDGDDEIVRINALTTLHLIGQADPASISPAAEQILPYLDADFVGFREPAMKCVATLAESRPESVVDAVPRLHPERVEPDDMYIAVRALSGIVEADPAVLESHTDSLLSVTAEESYDLETRVISLDIVSQVIRTDPEANRDIVHELVDLGQVEDLAIRGEVALDIAKIANTSPGVMTGHVDRIAPLLRAKSDQIRLNASIALTHVGETDPRAVTHLQPTYVELLTDDRSAIRRHACAVLGLIEAEASIPKLERLAATDPDAGVREAARRSLRSIKQ